MGKPTFQEAVNAYYDLGALAPTWREIREGLGINTNAVGDWIRGTRRDG